MIKIIVTEEHIKAGKKRDCEQCPIALAIKEQTKLALVRVRTCSVFSLTETMFLPDEASSFVTRFDTDLEVKPFTFNLLTYKEWKDEQGSDIPEDTPI